MYIGLYHVLKYHEYLHFATKYTYVFLQFSQQTAAIPVNTLSELISIKATNNDVWFTSVNTLFKSTVI